MSVPVKIGDVFYRIEPTDHKHYTRVCRVCEGKKNLTINEVTFKCPMCAQEQTTLFVRGYVVKRYRLFSVEHFIYNYDWKYDGREPEVRYQLYHKSGFGRYSRGVTHSVQKVDSYMFSGKSQYFNCQNPSEHSVNNCLYSDYKLAVNMADKLTQEQVEKVRAYNEENNTDYELPVFKIEHDKKSK